MMLGCHPEEGGTPSEGPYDDIRRQCSKRDHHGRMHRDAPSPRLRRYSIATYPIPSFSANCRARLPEIAPWIPRRGPSTKNQYPANPG